MKINLRFWKEITKRQLIIIIKLEGGEKRLNLKNNSTKYLEKRNIQPLLLLESNECIRRAEVAHSSLITKDVDKSSTLVSKDVDIENIQENIRVAESTSITTPHTSKRKRNVPPYKKKK